MSERACQARADERHRACYHFTRGAVEGDGVELVDLDAADLAFFLFEVDVEVGAAGHAGLAHGARHHGGVRGHAALRGQDALRDVHPVNVLGRGFHTHEDHPLLLVRHRLGVLGGEHHLARRRARRGAQPLGEHLDLGVRVDHRMKNLVELAGGHPHHGLLFADQPFAHHVEGNLDGGGRGALARAGLQEVQHTLLHGELQVLHIAVMAFEFFINPRERLVHLGHVRFQLVDGVRRANARNHVLALRVDHVLAVEFPFAGGGVAGERHARRRCRPHVAEHHRLHGDGGAPVAGDLVHAPVGAGAVGIPGFEHRLDSHPELLHWVVREFVVDALSDDGLELTDDRL